jgi:hypothetical protein
VGKGLKAIRLRSLTRQGANVIHEANADDAVVRVELNDGTQIPGAETMLG